MKLEGLRVIDLSMFLPGPHLTQMMRDHGAEVIRVEPPPEGEPSRKLGPVKDGHTPWFRNLHRGKKSLCLNLKKPQARDVLLKLCETADVFVESFRPGVAETLGIAYAQLEKINPGIVYCSITAFGQYGPKKNRPAHDLSVQAMSGLVSLNLGANEKPVLPGVPAADMAASLMAFGGIMMALYRQRETGQGDYVDISMQDSLMGWTQNIIGPVFGEDIQHDVKNERGWGGRGFYNIYETSDGRFLTLSGSEPKFVENVLNNLDRPDLIELAQSSPGAHQQPLIDFLSGTFIDKSLAYWDNWFADKDVCYGAILDVKEAFDDVHVKERAMLLQDGNGNKHIGIPVKFTNEPGELAFDVPDLNEDAEDLLRSINISARQIAEFRQIGIMPAAVTRDDRAQGDS
jgi:crotonobetainyl-CoA:carnitine CoA-transferase CaiB-like acyl-CoA transferase